MSAQHTPGPWEFRVYADGCMVVSKHVRPGSASVRDWLKGVEVKVATRVSDDQSDALLASPDARLIVAAPELLEALYGARGALFNLTGKGDKFAKREHARALAAVDAAIAKAAGSAS